MFLLCLTSLSISASSFQESLHKLSGCSIYPNGRLESTIMVNGSKRERLSNAFCSEYCSLLCFSSFTNVVRALAWQGTFLVLHRTRHFAPRAHGQRVMASLTRCPEVWTKLQRDVVYGSGPRLSQPCAQRKLQYKTSSSKKSH